MKLIWKFNLVLLGIFLLGFAISGFVSYRMLQANAREEILQNARLMMEAALASRNYTNTQVKPLLETQLKYVFLPQTVPAFAATEQFNEVRKTHKDYGYKEATLNPTNPRDRASDWEADVVQMFRQSRPTTAEVIGERDTPTGRSLYLARPIQIKSAACLECHSTAEAAPKTMIDLYGGAQRLRLEDERGHRRAGGVGADGGADRARERSRSARSCCRSPPCFSLAFVLLNVMLYTIVIRRVTQARRDRRPGEPRQPRRRRVQDQEQGRDRRADRGAGADEDEPRAGDEDAGGRQEAVAHPPARFRRPNPWPTRPNSASTRSRASSARARWASSTRPSIRTSSAPSRSRRCARTWSIRTLAAQFMARFKNEARAVGRLHHPNIVAIYEYGEDESVAYIAMEYVEGTGLREYLERKARFEFGHVVDIMRQLLRRAGLRARARRRPPRHQAGEPDPDDGRRAEGRGFRHRADRHVELTMTAW